MSWFPFFTSRRVADLPGHTGYPINVQINPSKIFFDEADAAMAEYGFSGQGYYGEYILLLPPMGKEHGLPLHLISDIGLQIEYYFQDAQVF